MREKFKRKEGNERKKEKKKRERKYQKIEIKDRRNIKKRRINR